MYDVFMTNPQTIVAAGRNGHVMRSADGGQNWSVQKVADQKLQALDFGDALHGWACGPSGTLIKTSDGGITWSPQTVPGNFDFADVDFLDAQNGWLVGPGVILRTSNGGSSWENVSPNTFFSAGGIHFINAQEGWFCGSTGRIMHSTDGGTSWTDQSSNTAEKLNEIRFLNAQKGWACGSNGKVLKTIDGGQTWTVNSVGITFIDLTGLLLLDEQKILVSGQNGTLCRSTDGGITWASVYPSQINADIHSVHASGNKIILTQAPPDNFPDIGKLAISSDEGLSWDRISRTLASPRCYIRDVLMRSQQELWAAGNSNDTGYVLKSTDSGLNWSKKTFNRGINAIGLQTASLGWIAGSGNQIYKTTDGGASWISQEPGNVSADYYDLQILDDQTLWVAGYDDNDEGVVIKSSDGGTTWTNVQGIASESINSIYFLDSQKGWAVGDNGVIRKTSNGGQSWDPVSIEFESGYLKSVFFTSVSTGYIVGASGHNYKTTDGGQTWNTAGLSGFKGLFYSRIQFIHPDTGFALRSDGKVFRTTDAAASWTETNITPARELYAIDMLNSRSGIIGGELAAILTSNGTLNTGLPNLLAEDGMVYPNPAKDYITLKLKSRIIDAEITGMDGRKFPADFSAENELDISKLKPGLYLIRIHTGKGPFLRKILVN
jgi:photosystem II stability/assembly factor-like uncharacterized protein